MALSDYSLTLILVLLISSLGLAMLGRLLYRELRYRKKPYYSKAVRNWAQQLPNPDFEVAHRIFLVGDFGNIRIDGPDPVLDILEVQLKQAGAASTVIFLGDNVYPVGLPEKGHRHRELAEKRLNRQLDALKEYKGRIIYLGGNHDWNKGREGGWDQVLRQEEYIEQRLHKGNVFLPDYGTPGPVAVQVGPGLAIIVINTQWWVQQGARPVDTDGASSTEKRFLKDFERLLNENRDKRIIIAAHHPLFSNAMHGGKFTFKQHMFPLRAAHKKLYVPLPLLGSLFPLYRQVIGAREDISHPRYRKLRKRLLKLFNSQKNLIYTAGHDHNLQHFCLNSNHYLVSGSASKTAFVAKGGKARFTHEHLGFFRIDFLLNNEAWLHAIEPDLESTSGAPKTVYRTQLY